MSRDDALGSFAKGAGISAPNSLYWETCRALPPIEATRRLDILDQLPQKPHHKMRLLPYIRSQA